MAIKLFLPPPEPSPPNLLLHGTVIPPERKSRVNVVPVHIDTLMQKNRGRKSLHRKSWKHEYEDWQDRIHFFTGMTRGNRFIYVWLIDDPAHGEKVGKPMTKNPISMKIKMPLGDETGENVSAALRKTFQDSIKLWAKVKHETLLGKTSVRPGKQSFGYFAKLVFDELLAEAIAHGSMPRGEMRDKLWPEVRRTRSRSQFRYTNERGGTLDRECREVLREKKAAPPPKPSRTAKRSARPGRSSPRWRT